MPAQMLAHDLDDLERTEVTWLWPGYLPVGKLTLIDGDPGQGKSLLSLDLAARLSTGRSWPDGAAGPAPGGVVLVNCEDGLSDTILPRLEELGADLGRVAAFQGYTVEDKFVSLPIFPRDVDTLRDLVKRKQARLVIIDPLMAFVDPMFSSINDQAIRQALLPLIQMAEETQCALLVIRHLNKTGAGRAIYRGSGSIGIVGCSRCAYLVGRNPEDPSVRVLACLKSNIAEPPPSLGFRVLRTDQLELEWLGPVDYSADDLVGAAAKKGNALERACDFLRVQLHEGPLDLEVLRARAKSASISERTLFRAKNALQARSIETGPQAGRRHLWTLAEPDSVAALLAGAPANSVRLPS